MQWPPAWKSASPLELLKRSPVNCLVIEQGPIADQARQMGITVVAPGQYPDGVRVLEGVWPGIRIARFGARDAVSAGPTGEPWVNSNIWPVRLERARSPEANVWIKAAPADPSGYVTALADAAITGGRWIITLDDALAGALAAGQTAALDTWSTITRAAAFFAEHRVWTDYIPKVVLGILSDFRSARTQELLNLITRAGQQYRVIPKDKLNAKSLEGLKAVIYADKDPLDPAGRSEVLTFVAAGGLLITGPEWPEIPEATPLPASHPRFTVFGSGRGFIAVSGKELTDPYQLASDSAILISHRHDLLRFWNGGALSAYFASAPDGRRAVVQVIFYSNRPMEDSSMWIAGNYSAAAISTFDRKQVGPVHFERRNGGVEIHLPRIGQYAAIELEA